MITPTLASTRVKSNVRDETVLEPQGQDQPRLQVLAGGGDTEERPLLRSLDGEDDGRGIVSASATICSVGNRMSGNESNHFCSAWRIASWL